MAQLSTGYRRCELLGHDIIVVGNFALLHDFARRDVGRR